MEQGKRATSLSTTRLSPLAEPFTLNRSVQTPSSSSSLLSPQLPSVPSLGQCDDDPFSSLLDSFRKSNMGSKVETVLPIETSLKVETSAQNKEKSVLEQYPSTELGKDGDFDGFRWSHFDILESSMIPTYSSSMVDDGSMLQNGNHAVDELNPSKAVSVGIFENSIGSIGGKDILSNSKGTINTADESSLPNYKISHLKFSIDASYAKNIPQNQSSKNIGGDSDSDVDSPCWKGMITFNVTASDTSGSAQILHVQKLLDKHTSLNPLAPEFIPGIGYLKDGFVSSNSGAPVATNLFLGEDSGMKTIMAESLIELNNGIELQHGTNICGSQNAFDMLNDPKSAFVEPVLNYHCMMIQSASKVDCSTSKGKLVKIADVDGYVKETKNPEANEPVSGIFPARNHSQFPTSTSTSTSSSSRVGVFAELFNTLKGFSKSLIESPKPDVHIMVSAMHVLSELLVQTCMDGVDSYNESDCDVILRIINNLNVLSTHKIEQRIPTQLDLTHADSPYCLGRSSSEPLKGPEVTSSKTLSVPNQLYAQGDYMGRNSVSEVFDESGQICLVSTSLHQGSEKGNEFTQLQVIRRNLGKKMDFEKQMQLEASLFWNLWLDAEAERCYRKFKTVRCLMEAGIDVNSPNIAELLR